MWEGVESKAERVSPVYIIPYTAMQHSGLSHDYLESMQSPFDLWR